MCSASGATHDRNSSGSHDIHTNSAGQEETRVMPGMLGKKHMGGEAVSARASLLQMAGCE
eukprot:4388826-Alexandrium_andersonii.AAC.1